jgi:hypothetical protein
MTQATIAMFQGDYKLIWYIGYAGYDNVYELYNLETDPKNWSICANPIPIFYFLWAASLKRDWLSPISPIGSRFDLGKMLPTN